MTLKSWLEKEGLPAYRFAREHGLASSVIYKHISGGKVDYDTAEKLSAATNGEVAVMEIYRQGRKA